MKKIISYGLLSMIVLFTACRKSDNPKVPTFTRVPVPNLIAGKTGDQAISVSTPTSATAFSANFSITLKFPNDIPPTKMDVVVRKNGNNSNVKLYQAGITSWPTTINVTGAKIISLFADSIRLGDSYDFGVDIYAADGTKYEAFPVVGIPYGSGVAGEYGGVATSVNYSAICGFTAADYAGLFDITNDPWQDFTPGTTQVIVTVIDATHLSVPSPVNGQPIIMTINPNTNEVTINDTNYGSYSGYGAVTMVTAGGIANNYVSPCAKKINIAANYIVAAGTFGGGPYPIEFVKH